MKIVIFSYNMLKANYKKSIFYGVTMAFSSAVILALLNIIFSDGYVSNTGEPIGMAFGLIVILMAVMVTFYANSFFLESRAKEIGVLTLAGVTVDKLAIMLLVQNFIVVAISLPIGFLLGTGLSFILNMLSYQYHGITGGNIFALYGDAYLVSIVFLTIQIVYLAFLNTSYVFRKEIRDLITINDQIYKPDQRNVRMPGEIYALVYFAPIVGFFFLKKDSLKETVFLLTCVGIYGSIGMIRYYVPKLIFNRKKKKHQADGVNLMTFGNLHYAIRSSELLGLLVCICTTGLVTAICTSLENLNMSFISMVSYVVITILLAICIVYKVLVEAMKRVRNFKQLQLLGFNKKQIIKTMKKEMVYFYTIIIGVSLPFIIAQLYPYISDNTIDFTLGIILISIFVGVFIIGGFISYITYKTYVLNNLKGGFGNE